MARWTATTNSATDRVSPIPKKFRWSSDTGLGPGKVMHLKKTGTRSSNEYAVQLNVAPQRRKTDIDHDGSIHTDSSWTNICLVPLPSALA